MASQFDDKTGRKVRFMLPANQPTNWFGDNQQKSQHSTKQYINGMLVTVNTTPPTPPATQPTTNPNHNSILTNSNDNIKIPKTETKIDINLNLAMNKNFDHFSPDEIKNKTEIRLPNKLQMDSNARPENLNQSSRISPPKKLTSVKSLPIINEKNVVKPPEKMNRRNSGLFSTTNKKSSENLNKLNDKSNNFNNTNALTQTQHKPLNNKILNKKSNFLHFSFNKTKDNQCTKTQNASSSKKNVLQKTNQNNINNNFNKSDIFADIDKFDNLSYLRNQYYSNKSIGQFLFVPEVNDDDHHEISTLNSLNQNRAKVSEDKSTSQVWNLLERWRKLRLVSHNNNNKMDYLNQKNSTSTLVNNHICMKSEEIRSVLVPPYRSYKMSLDKLPFVTTLLRAARDANELLLKDCLTEIKTNGITKDDLNSTDLNGRTAISYIASTTLIKILDEVLRLPGIDVNKPDNEGNTPLHFAAQAGIFECVNMLLTRSKSIKVDAKNNLGFTPLMKAALQGRTKCAKLLIFAGANPAEIDSGRGLRAEEWARFCGRFTCAELILKCSRTRLLEKTASCRWPNDSEGINKSPVIRTKTNPSAQVAQSHLVSSSSESFRSRFSKVLPFNFLREKNNSSSQKTMDSNTDLVTYLSAAALCASGPALPSNGNVNLIKSIIRPVEVPKLEITPAHQTLIKTLNKLEQKCIINNNCDNQRGNLKKKKFVF